MYQISPQKVICPLYLIAGKRATGSSGARLEHLSVICEFPFQKPAGLFLDFSFGDFKELPTRHHYPEQDAIRINQVASTKMRGMTKDLSSLHSSIPERD
jgi:hypothetical protein